MTIITDKLENSSTGYSLKAVKALIQHLKDEGWSFAYMGTDHDMDGVTVSLSITNVVKFEKTKAETQAVSEKESRISLGEFVEKFLGHGVCIVCYAILYMVHLPFGRGMFVDFQLLVKESILTSFCFSF